MAILHTEAIVLKKRDYSETSLLVDFFTRDAGKIKTIIKGARRNKNNIVGDLALFSHNHIVYYESRHVDLNKLTQSQLMDRFDGVREDITRIAIATYFIELIDNLSTIQDPNPKLFDALLWSLKSLSRSEHSCVISTIFQVKLLLLSGIMPNLKSCCTCKVPVSKEPFFSLLLGGAVCSRCADNEPSAIKVSERALAIIKSIAEFPSYGEDMIFGISQEIQEELNEILQSIFNLHLDKRLKSLEFLNKVC